MNLSIRSEWLADLLNNQRDFVTQCWIDDIRAEAISGYETVSDDELREELPPTVDSMIETFRTGDLEGPRQHSIGVIQQRLISGFKLPDLQRSLHALETSVMRIVKEAKLDPAKEYEALQAASNLYYLVALIAAAVYEQLRTEQQKRFMATYEFGVMLNNTLDLDAVLDIAVHKIAEYFNGDSAAILLEGSDTDRKQLRANLNIDEDLAKAIPDIYEALDCALIDTNDSDVRKSTCAVPDIREYERLSQWSELLTSANRLSLVCAPLTAKQRRLGTLLVFWSDVHPYNSTEMDFLFALAGHIASALQNAILYGEAKGKRELGILLDSSRLFASSLDMQDVLRRLTKMATEVTSADLAVAFVQSRMREHSDSAYYVRRRSTEAISNIVELIIAEGEENEFRSLGKDFRRGKPVICGGETECQGRLQLLAGLRLSVMLIPIRQKSAGLGALAIVSMVPNAFTEEDLLLAAGITDLALIAIENARLYEYERNIAETFQKSFRPSSLPNIEGYETAAYYRPAWAEAEIGGDFYDVFATSDGNTSVIIGDVSGKGLKAALPTVMSRYMVRAYAAENPLPSNLLTRFNRTFYDNAPEGLFMTTLYGTLDPRDNAFTYVSAGHDPPLLYSAASGQVTEIDSGGLCLGINAEATCVDKNIHMEPGDALLLYTDGATDVKGDRCRLEIEGLERLFLSTATESAEQIIKNVSDGIVNFSRGEPTDDVALVVLKRKGRFR